MASSYHPIPLSGLAPGRIGYVTVKTPGMEGQDMFAMAKCWRIARAVAQRPDKIEATLIAGDGTLFYVPANGFFDRIES